MKIKKVGEKRVKVLVESVDIEEYQVPYHRLSSADELSGKFLYALMLLIYEQTGISFTGQDILLEATPAYGGNYYITVTAGEQADGGFLLHKETELCDEVRIYLLESKDDLDGLAALFFQRPFFLPVNLSLYQYNASQYLIFEFSQNQTDSAEFQTLLLQIGEFLQEQKNAILFEAVLKERGTLVCPSLLSKLTNKSK